MDEGTVDDRRRDGGTNFILRIKEQETHLILPQHDDDDDNEIKRMPRKRSLTISSCRQQSAFNAFQKQPNPYKRSESYTE